MKSCAKVGTKRMPSTTVLQRTSFSFNTEHHFFKEVTSSSFMLTFLFRFSQSRRRPKSHLSETSNKFSLMSTLRHSLLPQFQKASQTRSKNGGTCITHVLCAKNEMKQEKDAKTILYLFKRKEQQKKRPNSFSSNVVSSSADAIFILTLKK